MPQALHQDPDRTKRARIRRLENIGQKGGQRRGQGRLLYCFLHPRNGSPMFARKPHCPHHFVQDANLGHLNERPQGPQDRRAKANGILRFKQLWKPFRQLWKLLNQEKELREPWPEGRFASNCSNFISQGYPDRGQRSSSSRRPMEETTVWEPGF